MASWDKYQYSPGLTFGSKMSAQQFIIRSRKDIFAQDGTKIDEIPELVAEFAVHGGEYAYENPYGEQDKAAVINGHYFDLDLFCDQRDLTDEEREFCAKRMLWWCEQAPGDVWLHTKAKAPAPWKTYDKTHHSKVADMAEATDTVGEALTYEQENKNRPSVVKELQAKLDAAPAPEPEVDDSLLQAA